MISAAERKGAMSICAIVGALLAYVTRQRVGRIALQPA